MSYRLANRAGGPRGGYDLRGRAFVLQPGEVRHGVDLAGSVVRLLMAGGVDVSVQAAVPPEVPPGARTPRQLLVAAEDGLAYDQLVREAETVLGDDYPAAARGRPSRDTIMDALRAAT